MYLTTKAVMFITFAVLLGIIGLLSCWKRFEKFYVLMVLFLLGLLWKFIWTNDPLNQERDYALVGSFYVFAIWIGLGLRTLWNFTKYLAPKIAGPVIICASLLAKFSWHKTGMITIVLIHFSYG
jgi:hypothetical protein